MTQVEFGENGAVLGPSGDDKTPRQRRKVKRVALACFVCALAAVLGVAFLGFLLSFALGLVASAMGVEPASDFALAAPSPFLLGIRWAAILSALNWVLFFITLPASWLALGFSIGRFPRRGIADADPYLRWASIWGAFLVGATTGIFSFLQHPTLSSGDGAMMIVLGATLGGVLIGMLAGVLCGALFLAIVRPRTQLNRLAETKLAVFD